MSPTRLALGVAAVAVLFWTIGALLPGHALPWASLDLREYFYPTYLAFYGSLRAGAPLLWNPWQLCGMPWLGTLQGGFFYPPHVLYVLLPTYRALALSTALHVGLAAAGAAAFAHRVGCSAAGATLAGIVFALVGPVRNWQLWPYMFEATAWLPLGALGVLDLARGATSRGTLIVALATGATFLAGSPQVAVHAGYLWAAFLAAFLLEQRPGRRAVVDAFAAFVGALAAGACVGAVALLPAFELAWAGTRSAGTLPVTLLYALDVPRPLDVLRLWLAGSRPVLLAALALVPLALVARAHRVVAGVTLLFAAVVILMALGPATPALHLYRTLPLLGWFREPHRLLIIAQLALGLLAGLGLDAIARSRRFGRVLAPLIVVVLAAAVALQGLAVPRPVVPLPYHAAAEPWSATHEAAYRRLAESAGHARVMPLSRGVGAAALPPKLPTLTRVRSLDDYEPLPLRRQAEYLAYFVEGSIRYSDPRATFAGRITSLVAPPGRPPPATRRRLLDLAAVRFVVMSPRVLPRPDVAAFARDAGLVSKPLFVPELVILENPHALPRAFTTYRTRRAPPADELLALVARETFDPLVESYVEGDPGEVPLDAPPRGAPGSILRDEPGVVEIEVTLAAPGLVVLADTFADGWTATVDGARGQILATNHLFRGVRAPAGTHRVRFAYRPWPLLLGGVVSLGAALALLAAALRYRANRS